VPVQNYEMHGALQYDTCGACHVAPTATVPDRLLTSACVEKLCPQYRCNTTSGQCTEAIYKPNDYPCKDGMCRNGKCTTSAKTCRPDPIANKCNKYKFNPTTKKCELERTVCPQQPPGACKMVSKQRHSLHSAVTDTVRLTVSTNRVQSLYSHCWQHCDDSHCGQALPGRPGRQTYDWQTNHCSKGRSCCSLSKTAVMAQACQLWSI
jgi:hypothetical protein